MWHRYCEGDVPSLRHMQMLEQPVVSEEPATKISEPTGNTSSREHPPGSIKINGFGPLPPSMPNVSACEENGGQLNQNVKSGKLS